MVKRTGELMIQDVVLFSLCHLKFSHLFCHSFTFRTCTKFLACTKPLFHSVVKIKYLLVWKENLMVLCEEAEYIEQPLVVGRSSENHLLPRTFLKYPICRNCTFYILRYRKCMNPMAIYNLAFIFIFYFCPHFYFCLFVSLLSL